MSVVCYDVRLHLPSKSFHGVAVAAGLKGRCCCLPVAMNLATFSILQRHAVIFGVLSMAQRKALGKRANDGSNISYLLKWAWSSK